MEIVAIFIVGALAYFIFRKVKNGKRENDVFLIYQELKGNPDELSMLPNGIDTNLISTKGSTRKKKKKGWQKI